MHVTINELITAIYKTPFCSLITSSGLPKGTSLAVTTSFDVFFVKIRLGV